MNINDIGLSAEEPTKREQTKQLVKEAQETTQQAERPRGVISDIGDAIDKGGVLTYLDAGLENLANTLEGTFAGDKLVRPIADVVPSDEELREFTSNIPVVGKAMTAFETGAYQGGMTAIGLTPAARVFNQQANWDNRPEVLKDGNILENGIYDTAKIATPTLIWLKGRGAALVGSGGMRLVESMVEAIGQDSADDLIAGRQLAGYFGNMYGELTTPEEGAKLTRDLIAGDNAAVAPFLYMWATANNMTINTASDYFFRFLGEGGKRLLRNLANNGGNVEAIAKATGKSADQVAEELTSTRAPEYTVDAEPSEAITPEVVNLQQKPTDGKFNLSGFLNKLRSEQTGVGLDLNDPSNFFYDWSKVGGGNEKIQMQIQKAFLGKIAPEAGSLARARILRGTAQFILENGQYIGKDNETLLAKMMYYGGFVDRNPTRLPDGAWSSPSASFQAHREMEKDFAGYFERNIGIDINTEEGIIGVAFSRYLGEQAGANLVTVANQIAKLKQTGQDPQKLIDEVLIPNQRFMRAALTPLRKAKRQFYLLGEGQQGEFQSDLRALLGEVPDKSPSKALAGDTGQFGIKVDGELVTFDIEPSKGDVDVIEQLNTLAKAGDEKAKEILDLVLTNIQFGDPKKVIGNLEVSSDIVKEAMQTKDGWQKYFYNFAALGGLSTQTNAAGATVFRQVLEPIALATAAYNPMNRNVKPIDGLYGIGQLVGGMYHLKSSFTAGLRALATNIPVSGKDRFTDSYSTNLRAELAQIRLMHRHQYEQQLKNNTNGLIIAATHMGRLGREIAYHPFFNTATRLLMAGDEAAKVTTAGQIAWGRAFVNLWDRGEFRPDQMMAQIKMEESKIFRGPAWKGDIIDDEVKAVAERVTLQESFDIGPESNPVERLFAAAAEANKMSMINRVFNAFPRAAYRQIEQEYFDNVLGSIPGASRFNKKIQAIRNSPDQTQRLALDAQQSLSHLVAGSLGIASLISIYGAGDEEVFGYKLPQVEITPEGIVVEGEDYDSQIAFDKFSPASVLLSIIGNINQAFITGQTSEESFGDQILAFTQGILSGIIDRNLLQGQQKFARTVNVGSPTWADNTFGFLWDFITPNIVREVADLIQPYATVQQDKTSGVASVLAQGGRVGFNNIHNPPVWDIYNTSRQTNPQPKVGTIDPFSEGKTRQGMAASMLWPGRVTPTRYFDPVMKAMTTYGYSVSKDYLRNIHGVELTPDEQSALSFAIQGRLYPKLKTFVNSNEFKKLKKLYADDAKKFGKNSNQAKVHRSKIFLKFNKIHDRVKRDAIIKSELYKDPRIKEALEAQQLLSEPEVGALRPERQGMFKTAATTQNTQIASEVRNLLDLPV